MDETFTKCFTDGLEFALGRYETFLDICPDDAWQSKFGRWPLAQQYYHGLMATGMLLASLSGSQVENPNPQAGQLGDEEGSLPTKAQAARFLANIRQAVARLGASLTDPALLQKNEAVSQKLGRETSNAGVLELMACHLLYHLGSCDAGLREKDLPGAW